MPAEQRSLSTSKTYRPSHPSYRIKNPFPDEFVDQEGIQWKRIPAMRRHNTGDYLFISEDDEEDYTDFEQMLMWDVRPVEQTTEED